MIRQIEKRAHLAGFAAVALLALGTAACGGGEVETVDEQPTILLAPSDVALVDTVSLASGVALTGTLNPYLRVEVKAQVPGVVTQLSAERGQSVGAGAVLARIEAEGITSTAAGARSGVAAAEASLALAQRQLESARTLFEAGAMSEIDFRAAQTQFEAAQAQLAAARAQAAGANEQAARTQVTAPFAGQVSQRMVNQGEAVNPGQSLFEVVNSAFLELEGQVPVDRAISVKEGLPVVFTIDAFPGREFRGTVSRVAPVADMQTRQVGVTLRLPNEDRGIIGGLFATGRVLTEAATQATVVPVSAVRGTAGDNFVYVIENETVVRRPVTTGTHDTTRGVIAINAGLQVGERVVVAPGAIAEGARIRTQQAAATPASTESSAVSASH